MDIPPEMWYTIINTNPFAQGVRLLCSTSKYFQALDPIREWIDYWYDIKTNSDLPHETWYEIMRCAAESRPFLASREEYMQIAPKDNVEYWCNLQILGESILYPVVEIESLNIVDYALYNNIEMVKYMVKTDDYDVHEIRLAQFVSCYKGYWKIVKFFAAEEFRGDSYDPFFELLRAFDEVNFDKINMLIELYNINLDNEFNLVKAALSSNLEVIQFFVESYGIEVDYDYGFPLLHAIKFNQPNIVKYLCQKDCIIDDIAVKYAYEHSYDEIIDILRMFVNVDEIIHV